MMRYFFTLVIAVFIAVPALMGQSGNSNEEMSIEESYLQEEMEMMMIREASRSNNREQKLVALEHIGNALERGNTSDELRKNLEYLSLESTQNKANENRLLLNNYPDVRRQAAKYLGDIGTEEAKNVLLKICTVDPEPMVLWETIKSLGSINSDNNDSTVNIIVRTVNKFHNSKAPDSLLALATVETLDKIAEKDRGLNANGQLLLIKIAEGPYAQPVKERAKKALADMQKYVAEGKEEQGKTAQ